MVYYAADAPEVGWARSRLDPAWGPVTGVEAFFADPYRSMDQGRRSSVYVSSWADSGINALSVLNWFLTPTRVQRLTPAGPGGLTYTAQVEYESAGRPGTGEITTSWDTDQASKRTALTFASGARLLLDHQRVTGTVHDSRRHADTFAYTGTTPRLAAHYLAAFQALLLGGEHFHTTDHTRLHHLLYQHTQ